MGAVSHRNSLSVAVPPEGTMSTQDEQREPQSFDDTIRAEHHGRGVMTGQLSTPEESPTAKKFAAWMRGTPEEVEPQDTGEGAVRFDIDGHLIENE
jgi:hypothetical protein